MQKAIEKPDLALYLEAENPKNQLGVQLRVWKTKNGTEVIVRIENQNNVADKLWQNEKSRINNGDVSLKVLHFLKYMEIIKNTENWSSSASRTQEVIKMDEYEDTEKCIYFVFYVHHYLIKF
ncbi:MAG: hypothetical protein WCL18_09280 [bacterium]